MKKKKFERQQAEKAQKVEQVREEVLADLQSVKLTAVDDQSIDYIKQYHWTCPENHGSFVYSKQINGQWGHPEDLAFCGVCCKYYKPEKG